jgi:hypothetical protein
MRRKKKTQAGAEDKDYVKGLAGAKVRFDQFRPYR